MKNNQISFTASELIRGNIFDVVFFCRGLGRGDGEGRMASMKMSWRTGRGHAIPPWVSAYRALLQARVWRTRLPPAGESGHSITAPYKTYIVSGPSPVVLYHATPFRKHAWANTYKMLSNLYTQDMYLSNASVFWFSQPLQRDLYFIYQRSPDDQDVQIHGLIW